MQKTNNVLLCDNEYQMSHKSEFVKKHFMSDLDRETS